MAKKNGWALHKGFGHQTEDQPKAIQTNVSHEDFHTQNLKALIEAAKKFWKNADPKQKDTHPKNAEVIEWLTAEDGQWKLPKRQAQVGASIIRPEWAAKGKPKK